MSRCWVSRETGSSLSTGTSWGSNSYLPSFHENICTIVSIICSWIISMRPSFGTRPFLIRIFPNLTCSVFCISIAFSKSWEVINPFLIKIFPSLLPSGLLCDFNPAIFPFIKLNSTLSILPSIYRIPVFLWKYISWRISANPNSCKKPSNAISAESSWKHLLQQSHKQELNLSAISTQKKRKYDP